MKLTQKKMENFETRKINTETLPEYLRAARESFYYGIRDVAATTNISEKFLEAMEQGYYHKLPADVYVYGFLKKLGNLYQVDPEILIQQYKKERGIHDKMNKTRQQARSFTPPKLAINPKTIGLFLLTTFIIFILGYLFYQVHAINKPPLLKITDPQDGAHINSSSLVIQGQTDPGTKLTIEGENNNIFVDSQGNFKALIGIVPGEKILNIVATNNFGKETTKQLLVIGDFQTQAQAAQQGQPLTLELDIGPNPTFISIKVDNDPQKDETVLPGNVRTYSAKDKIVLTTGDAGSTQVKLNGKDLGKLGRDGEILRDIVFTPGQ